MTPTIMPLPPIEADEALIVIPEAQAELGNCSRNTILRLIADGTVDAVKMGRRLLIRRASIRRHRQNLPRAVVKPDPRRTAVAPPAEPIVRRRRK